MTDKPKRPGTMSDDERAMIGKEHRVRALAPAAGVAIVPTNEFAKGRHDFTPVTEVIARIEQVMTLDERDRLLIHLFWEHTANMTMRWANTDAAALDARIDDLESSIVDISGLDGKNGKLGALKERVDKAESRRWWVVTTAAGLVVTVITAAIAFGSWMGSIETDVEVLKLRVNRTRAPNALQPDFPAKDQSP